MAINFIPNDPLADPAAPVLRNQPERPDRPAGSAGFSFSGMVPAGTFAPMTPEFLFWQCREAALAALETWESFEGNLSAWSSEAADPHSLPLRQNAGNVLNAFYDRQSFSFFQFVSPGKTTFSGASTDVVSHEVGHGLLDSVRTDLFDSNFLEAAAFHEGFADCMALLTALHDQPSRLAVLAVSPDLSTGNFLETAQEDLAAGVRVAFGPKNNAAQPRHALNGFQFQIPSTLPDDGPPGTLINESHSFGQILSGCFYDCVRNTFVGMAHQGEQDLLLASRTAATLLLAGVRSAPLVPRFIESVGRSMLAADQQSNAGGNQAAILAAFDRHGIKLGGDGTLAPKADLAGGGPVVTPKGAVNLASVTQKDLLKRIGATARSKLEVSQAEVHGEKVVRAMHRREVALDGIDKRFSGVTAYAAEPMFVGTMGKSAVLLGALPEQNTTESEVKSYVRSLVAHDRISFEPETRQAISTDNDATSTRTTHKIVTRRGKKVLVRVRMLCG